MAPAKKIPVYVEAGRRRVFACAVEWPGWVRGGRDEAAAIQALLDYAPRYGRALAKSRIGFAAPKTRAELAVVERLEGDASTNMGTPERVPSADERPVDTAELQRLRAILEAAWSTFDAAAERARGKVLTKGPRGGGRDLPKILAHQREGERYYLSGLGWRYTGSTKGDFREEIRRTVLEGLAASARGEIPARGPRGGVRWTPRFFVRRVAWHALDHAWEIEDRTPPAQRPSAT